PRLHRGDPGEEGRPGPGAGDLRESVRSQARRSGELRLLEDPLRPPRRGGEGGQVRKRPGQSQDRREFPAVEPEQLRAQGTLRGTEEGAGGQAACGIQEVKGVFSWRTGTCRRKPSWSWSWWEWQWSSPGRCSPRRRAEWLRPRRAGS